MLAAERKQQIKEIIIAKKSASVAALAEQFGVTGETIRRDLKALEKEGVLMRTHGGAFIQSGVENLIDIDLRKAVYINEKELIAKRCCNLVNNGDAIFLDNSTTCYHIAKALSDLNITVVTNNLMIMNLFAQSENIRLVSVGGEFSRHFLERLRNEPLPNTTLTRHLSRAEPFPSTTASPSQPTSGRPSVT